MTSLPSLRPGLLRHPLLDQVLVYDTEKDKLHLLDGTTAAVVELLDKGDSADTIVAKLEQQQGTDGGSQLLALALDELEKAELTEGTAKISAPMQEVTRRQMLQKFAGVGAAVLIPAIVSFTPSVAYALSNVACSGACTVTSECGPSCPCCRKGSGSTDHTCKNDAVNSTNCYF